MSRAFKIKPPKCIDGSICRMWQGCHECESHESQLTQLVNLESAGLHGTPEHVQLKRAIELLHNDMSYAMRLFHTFSRHMSWADQYFMSWTNQLAMIIHERVQAIIGMGIDLATVNWQQRTSWEQFAADPPPVLIMYRSFIARTTTNTDPPHATHGIHRDLSVITCAGHC